TRERFEKIVGNGVEAIPEKFLRILSNVAIVVEDEPTPDQKKKLNIHPNWTLFGLYEGYADYGQTNKRTLEAGDIAGVQELYK
ncbi:metallopeptidase family protein, partial [Patescibacteria group bacterium]|nr:metallopeptidase family protein [Patescibacteria group bacterium]